MGRHLSEDGGCGQPALNSNLYTHRLGMIRNMANLEGMLNLENLVLCSNPSLSISMSPSFKVSDILSDIDPF